MASRALRSRLSPHQQQRRHVHQLVDVPLSARQVARGSAATDPARTVRRVVIRAVPAKTAALWGVRGRQARDLSWAQCVNCHRGSANDGRCCTGVFVRATAASLHAVRMPVGAQRATGDWGLCQWRRSSSAGSQTAATPKTKSVASTRPIRLGARPLRNGDAGTAVRRALPDDDGCARQCLSRMAA